MFPKVSFDSEINEPYQFVDWQSYFTPIWTSSAALLALIGNVCHVLIIWHILKSPLRVIDYILLGDQVLQDFFQKSRKVFTVHFEK